MFLSECKVSGSGLCFVLMLTYGVTIIILLYYILYIYYYILYLILYSSLLLFFFLSFSSPSLQILSLLPFLSLPLQSSSSSIPSIFPHSQNTCRYLHILIYILPIILSSSDNLTPHKLTEWMVEVCRFEVCGVLLV